MRRAASEKLSRSSVKAFYETQMKEAVIQACDLLDEPAQWDRNFRRTAASMTMSVVYGHPTLTYVARQIALVSSGGKRWVSIQRRGRVCVGSFARANTRHPQAEEAGRRKGKGTAAHRSENGGKVISIVECLVTRLCTWGRGSDASPVLPDR